MYILTIYLFAYTTRKISSFCVLTFIAVSLNELYNASEHFLNVLFLTNICQNISLIKARAASFLLSVLIYPTSGHADCLKPLTLARASSPCCHMNLAIFCRFMSTAQIMSSLNGYLNTSCTDMSTGRGTSVTMLPMWWPCKTEREAPLLHDRQFSRSYYSYYM